MAAVRVIYLVLATAFLVMLLGFAISAFYESPEYSSSRALRQPYEEEAQLYEEARQSYEEARQSHSRNVFFIGYAYGVALLALGAKLRPRLDIIRPALLLGGLGAIIYAIAQPHLASEFRFAGAAAGFAVLLYVGYKTLLEAKPSHEEET